MKSLGLCITMLVVLGVGLTVSYSGIGWLFTYDGLLLYTFMANVAACGAFAAAGGPLMRPSGGGDTEG